MRSTSTHPVPWEGGENLLSHGVTIVPDNKLAGTINGARLASAAPYANCRSPLAAADVISSARVVVRCEARHNHVKGENRKSDSASLRLFVAAPSTCHVLFVSKVLLFPWQ